MTSVRDILRSATHRFLPGWVTGLVLFPLLFAPHSFLELGPTELALLSSFTLATLAGHALVLFTLRRHLRVDADVVGRKSFVSGMCSVGALFITSMMRHGPRGHAGTFLIYAGVGAAVTAAMYLPWLRGASADNGASNTFVGRSLALHAAGLESSELARTPVRAVPTRTDAEFVRRPARLGGILRRLTNAAADTPEA